MTDKPLVCMHCGAKIEGAAFIEKEGGLYIGEECYFRDTYLDGIVDRIEASYLATIEAFVNAIDAREHETGNHSLRVSRFAVILGYRFGMRGRDLVDLYCGALLHDIGKIGVPDAVLLKQGPLSPEEGEVMHKHPVTGYRIIGHIGYLKNAAEIIHAHHEHFDGSGYPLGLRGDDIPPGARVFSVADALDALTVARPYRKALRFEDAVAEIEKESGRIFDPAVVSVLNAALDELRSFVGKIPSFNLPSAR
ncbi:MAG: HD-GYP domain-containing protein [Nitrospiraceae bacterium]|nr:HD-GYP domain-containing protein [Nitrospiraceae bacterium]